MIRNEKKYLIIIVILIAVNLFLFSGISPLHSIYNMQYDEWIFYLIGKGMVNGKVPYLDLADHKGPYLFYLFALMNLMPSNHLGLFIVSTIIYAVIGIFVFKISCLILSARTARAYGTGELYEPLLALVALVVGLLITIFIRQNFFFCLPEAITLASLVHLLKITLLKNFDINGKIIINFSRILSILIAIVGIVLFIMRYTE